MIWRVGQASARAAGPFVVINAATMEPDTVEIELFGAEAADGRARKVGALEEAHGGTLYLDEVADMPKETQGKILRVLVDQNFQRVGGATRVHVDVRIISSTGRAGSSRCSQYRSMTSVPRCRRLASKSPIISAGDKREILIRAKSG